MTILQSCLVLWLLWATASADYCPSAINSQIQECVQPVGDYAKLLNNNQTVHGDDSSRNSRRPPGDFGAFSLPNMGKKVFSDLCRLVAKFNVCVKELRARCPRHVTIGLIDSSYGYLCNEGYNTFMESAECLMELDRKPQVKACHDETLKEIEKANGDSALGLGPKVERMCSALNFFAGCVKTPIKDECGGPAWRVIYRVLRDTTRTLMPGCKFSVPSMSTTTPHPDDMVDEIEAEPPLNDESGSPESRPIRLTASLTTAVPITTTVTSAIQLEYETEEIRYPESGVPYRPTVAVAGYSASSSSNMLRDLLPLLGSSLLIAFLV